jgi:hypothetical protein
MKLIKFFSKVFSADALTRALPSLAIILGFVLLVVSFWALSPAENPTAHGIVLSVAQAVLVGGVVGVLTNALRYMGIFSEAVHQVFFSEEHLRNRADLSDVWMRVTSALTRGKFPSLAQYLKTDVIKNYIPAEKNFYYSRYYRECIIKWSNSEKTMIIIEENIEIDIIPQDLSVIDYTYRCMTNSKVNRIDDHFSLELLEVNGTDHRDRLVIGQYNDEYGGNGTNHDYNIKLSGHPKYMVRRSTRRKMDISVEPFLEYSSRNFILETTVKFKSDSPDLVPIFVSVGTDDFDNHSGKSGWPVHRTFPSLMFPNQGYLLIVQKSDPI